MGFLLLGALEGEARAQVPIDAYQDLKGIIEDLLTAEVAHSVVPSVACLAGRKKASSDDEGAPFTVDMRGAHYQLELIDAYPKTLQKVYNRQFGSLRNAIREESADLAAYTIYTALTKSDGETKVKLAKLAGLPADKGTGKGVADMSEAGAGLEFAPLSSERKQPVPLVPITIGDSDFDTCKKQVAKYFDGRFEPPIQSRLDSACAEEKKRSYACNFAFALRAALQDKPAVAEDHLVRATAAVLGESLATAFPQTPGSREIFLDNLVLTIRDTLYQKNVSQEGIARNLTALVRAHLRNGALVQLAPVQDKDGAGAGRGGVDGKVRPTPPNPSERGDESADPMAPPDPMAERLEPYVAGLRRLQSQWWLATQGGQAHMDVATFVASLASPSGYIGLLCPKDREGSAPGVSGAGACAPVDSQAREIGPGKQLWSLVRLAGQGEYKDVAQLTMGSLFFAAESEKKCSEGGCEQLRLYRRFAQAVVAYTLDVYDEKQPSAATREAFRGAATDVIRDLSEGGGIERRTNGASIILPDLALRLSWSPGYVNSGDGSARYLASVNWLNARLLLKRSELMYGALQLSFVDAIAPLNELAMRRSDVSYSNQSTLVANMICPRLDVLLGVPALSKHLVAAAGINLRPVVPYRLSTDTQEYEYRSLLDARDSWPKHVEFGFALKYML